MYVHNVSTFFKGRNVKNLHTSAALYFVAIVLKIHALR